jgi:hypothetical protein
MKHPTTVLQQNQMDQFNMRVQWKNCAIKSNVTINHDISSRRVGHAASAGITDGSKISLKINISVKKVTHVNRA